MKQKEGLYRRWHSVRTRTMMTLLCVNTVIILLLSLGAFWFFQDSFIREIASNRTDVLRQISERARQFKANAYTLSDLYCTDVRFRQYVVGLNVDNAEEFRAYMDQVTQQLQVSFNQVNLEFYTVFLSADGIGYCSLPVPEDYDYMNPQIKIWYKDIYYAAGEIVDVASYRDKALGINSFSAARTITNGDEVLGYLMVNADERQLWRTYSDVISEDSNIYITDPHGRIVSSNQEQIIGFSYFSMSNLERMFNGRDYIITDIAGQSALFTRYYDLESGFTVFEEIPMVSVLEPIERIRRVVVLMALLTMAGGAALAWHFSGQIARPIRCLRDDVKAVEEGDLNRRFSTGGFTEADDLSRGMTGMLARIRELISSVRTKEEQKRRMELNWLQAQINPHFMYNTLFSIQCMVDMHRNEEAGRMLTTFIQILRGTLSSPNEMVTVRSQMESLRQYVELQKFRYGDSFDALIECDEQVADCLLPKLLVQPLVENSLMHGIDMNTGCGVITVVARLQEDAVCIQVEDNGVGMSQERIRQVMENREDDDRPHLGVRNVHERIRLYYGEPWGLRIESSPGHGTRITLRIPASGAQQKGELC